MSLVPTEETINKLFNLGFKHIGITPFSGAVSIGAQIDTLKPDQLKTLADIPGFMYITNSGVGSMRLVFSGDAVEEMED